MKHLEQYFKHDDTVDNIVLDVKSKMLQFTVSNYIEELANYESHEILFNEISNININHFSFIDSLTNYGLDILTFNQKKLEDGLDEFELILMPVHSNLDVRILFTCHVNNILIK